MHQKHPVPNVAVSVFFPAGIISSLILVFLWMGCFVDGAQEAQNIANVVKILGNDVAFGIGMYMYAYDKRQVLNVR